MKMSLEIRVRGNNNFSFSLFYVLSFVSFLRVFQFYFQADIYNYQPLHLPQPKESTKENKENTHCFLRLHGVLRRSAVFSFFGFAEPLTLTIVLRTRSRNKLNTDNKMIPSLLE